MYAPKQNIYLFFVIFYFIFILFYEKCIVSHIERMEYENSSWLNIMIL
jgi:hypothetical protein